MKKVLSLVLVVVLVLGMMPAFAATPTGAENLFSFGFIAGDNGDLMVNKELTRAEIAVLVAELFGKKTEAMNFAAPANFSDVAVGTWYAPYVAYGQAQGWFAGYPNGTYAPEASASAAEFAAVLMNALGYKGDFDFATVVAFAATKNVNVASAGAKILRGEAFESMWVAVNEPAKGQTVSLGVQLGRLTPVVVAPATFEVTSVSASNLKQIEVKFNQDVDADSAETEGNYTITNDSDVELATTLYTAELQADKKTVVITLTTAAANQKSFEVVVADVENTDGKAIADTTKTVAFLDTTLPTIVKAEIVGVSTVKVTFSEPMMTFTASDFKVNDGKYYVKGVTGQSNNTELMVELYTALKAGDLPFEVKASVLDYAGFGPKAAQTFTLTVVEDTTAPTVVSYKSAKPESIVLVWSEDVNFVTTTLANYYHTNSDSSVNAIPTLTNGTDLKLTFATAKKLPEGTAYVYVKKESVKDLWNNKNAQQMIKVEVTVDKEAPVATAVEFKTESKIIVKFSEEMGTPKTTHFQILDKDGKEIAKLVNKVTLASDEKSVTVEFKEAQDGGDYSVVVKDIEDKAGNEIAATTLKFTVTDKTAPDLALTTVKAYTINSKDTVLKVKFKEAMATTGAYSVADLSKYILNTSAGAKAVEDITDVTITVVDSGKAVEIKFPAAKQAVVAGTDTLTIARVADAAGNYTALLSSGNLPIVASSTVAVSSVKATAKKTVVVTFNSELTKFDAADFVIFEDTNGDNVQAIGELTIAIDSVTTALNSDNNTVATFNLAGEYTTGTAKFTGFAYDASNAGFVTKATVASENKYGEKVVASTSVNVSDKIVAALAVQGADDEDYVTLTTGTSVKTTTENVIVLKFKEAINGAYVSFNTFEVTGFDVVAIIVDDNATVTDGTASATGMYVKIYIDAADENAEVGTVVTLKSPIQDIVGNVTETIATEVYVLN